ncbi:MAG: type II toxin-antitoxin system HicB family antitoxin [Gammaproteobacteria bacterium]|nr:type II toxin-antitoxin system HicB family antitoxin [Gammaproteobacteria bacterium]
MIELRNGMTLGYELRNGWWVGQLAERPEVISQGKTREDLIEMILDAEELCGSVQRERLHGSPDSQSSGTRAKGRLGDGT